MQHTKSKVDAMMLIIKLNPILRGWASYYRSSQSTDVCKSIGKYLYETIWRRIVKTNPGAEKRTLAKKFFMTENARKWIFFHKDSKTDMLYKLYQIADTLSVAHILIKGGANPFDVEYHDYLLKRAENGAKGNLLMTSLKRILAVKQKALCPVCENGLFNSRETLEVHHIKPIEHGGGDELSNLVLLHKTCHGQITNIKDPKLIAAFKEKGLILTDKPLSKKGL